MKLSLTKATKIAIRVASQSTLKRYHLGAVLYDKNQYVTGFNHVHGVKVQSRKNKWSIHAEEMAIIKGSRTGIDFKNSILVVARINNNNSETLLAKPCIHCQKLINQMQIPQVFYTNDPVTKL